MYFRKKLKLIFGNWYHLVTRIFRLLTFLGTPSKWYRNSVSRAVLEMMRVDRDMTISIVIIQFFNLKNVLKTQKCSQKFKKFFINMQLLFLRNFKGQGAKNEYAFQPSC